MKKWSFFAAVVIQMVLIQTSLSAQQLTLLKKTTLNQYPSSSAIEFYKNRLFVIGDDATQMLVLDAEHKIIDSVHLFEGSTKRMSKDEKADIEALTIIQKNEKPFLLAISSFSTSKRNFAIHISLDDLKVAEKPRHSRLIKQYKKAGLATPNIEGLTTFNNTMLLSNRANKSQTDNHLFLTNQLENGKLKLTTESITRVELPATKGVVGISGLTYVAEKDMLIFTASTEDTDNAYSDGTIGESYLGYISNFSKKWGTKIISADKLMPLSKVLNSGFQKIESVCVESYKNGTATIHLASDNDNGKSTLFKMALLF